MKRALFLAPLFLAGVAAVAPTQSQIPVSTFSNTYSYVSHTRGFWFVAPKDFIVTSVQVPDETKHGQQNVAVYNQGLITTPTTATAAHLKFYKTGQPSNVPQACNVYFKANELFAVLGACGDTTTMHNSYGAGGFASNVLGSPVTLQRLTLQANLIASAGLGTLGNGGTGSIGRVFVTVVPPKGLFPDFEAANTMVASGVPVKFTDKTYTSDPGGVKTWAWDFNGDNVTDSTVAAPSFIYPYAGKTTTYDVSLTVTDAVTPGGKSITKKAYITVDPPPVADFDATPRAGGAPLLVQFTDKSVGAGTWAWDFNNDNVVDSTVQNPKFGYSPGTYTVKLTVTNKGGSDSTTKANFIRVLQPGQNVQTVPAGYLTTEGPSSTSYAWGRYNSANGHRIQYCYDRTHFKATNPIIISALRFRANASPTQTWTGGTHKGAIIQLSTCATTPATMSTTFASNHGADVKTVFTGDVTLTPQTTPDPNSPRQSWYVTVNLTTPFLFDPTQGDLLFDLTLPGPLNITLFSQLYYVDYVSGTAANAYYVYSYSDASATTGSGPYSGGMIIELTYANAALNAGFDATPTIGSGPLTVNFKDTSYSNQTGGVQTWAWDFNGDNVVDSTVQNPTFIYPSVNKTATYDVSLTVTDGFNPTSTLTRKGFITVDPPPVADFDATPRSGAVRPGLPPLIVKFTDKSVGANAWAWDFNGDNVTDSTVQNPQYPYIAAGIFDVTLSVTGVGGSDKITKKGFIVVNDKQVLTTLFTGGNGGSSGWCNFFDLDIKNPGGLWITALDVNASTYNVALTLDIYTSPLTYVNKETTPTAWTLKATGTGTTAAAANLPTRVDISNLYLPQGKYGIAIHYKGAGMSYTDGTGTGPGGNQVYSTADLTLTAGSSNGSTVTAPFTGTSTFTPRVWNGTLYYATRGWGDLGTYGVGCTGSNGVPTLAAATSMIAAVGKTVKMDMANMPVAGGAVLVLNGFGKDKLLGLIPLPWDLTGLGAAGCNVLTDISFTLPAANVGGTGSFNLSIPNDPALIFGVVFSQAAVLDPTANTLGVTFTNGAEMIIGG